MKSLDLNKLPFIEELVSGNLQNGKFLLRQISIHKSKQSKYLRMILADKTGHLPAIYFSSSVEIEKLYSELKGGSIIETNGVIESYKGIIQLKALSIKESTDTDIDLSRFWRRTPHDRRTLYRDLKNLLQEISQPALKELCTAFLKSSDFMRSFIDAPASRRAHHAYIGGLLEHTVNVLKLLKQFSIIYPQSDHDLLLAGGFIRKIGKVDEYETLQLSIDTSDLGKLKGHTLLGYDRLKKEIEKIPIDEKVRLKLEHIILSHQGKKEWGAIEEPRFLEAYLVHAADQLDATRFIYSEAKNQVQRDSPWSGVNEYIGREIYLG